MLRKILPFLVSLFFFLAFVAFSYLVHKDLFTQLDFNTTVILQDKVPRRLDGFFSLLSDVGSFEPVIIFLILVLLARRKIIAGLGTFFAFGMFHIFELFGKNFVDHLPPPQFMLRTLHQVEFPQFHVRAEYSYPSGHSGRAVFLGAFLLYWIWTSQKLSLPIKSFFTLGILGYVVIMLVSRVYLGEHWSTDVVGGAILGFSLGVFSANLFEIPFLKPFKKKTSGKAGTLHI